MIAYAIIFATFAFFLGACIGSFLNVVIYRLPRNLSVNEPKRSFCPNCKEPIPLSRNIPLITWLWQRGKAACCGAPIIPRYFIVELLTGLLFLAIWIVQTQENAAILAPIYWVMTAMLIAGSFIDFEHYLIPDELTWGLAAAGLFFSFVVPPLMTSGAGARATYGFIPMDPNPLNYTFNERIQALGFSVFGAAVGFITVRAILEAGKLMFGRRRLKPESPQPFHWVRYGDDAKLKIGDKNILNLYPETPAGEPDQWSNLFERVSDRMIFDCERLEINGEVFENVKPKFSWERLYLAMPDKSIREWKLDELDEIKGVLREVVIPREAMGHGDVKLMAGIGAFLGWEAVYFSIFAASIVGCLVTLTLIALRKREFSKLIPFGPYLALGALLWTFFGWDLLNWYMGFLNPENY